MPTNKELGAEIKALRKDLSEQGRKQEEVAAIAAATKEEFQKYAGTTPTPEWIPPAYESYPERWRHEWDEARQRQGASIEPITFTPDRDFEFKMDGFQIALRKGVECQVPQRVVDEVAWRTPEE